MYVPHNFQYDCQKKEILLQLTIQTPKLHVFLISIVATLAENNFYVNKTVSSTLLY